MLSSKIKKVSIGAAVLASTLVLATGCNNGDNAVQSAAVSSISTEANDESDKPSIVAQTMVVYKSPTCGCCQSWVDYLEEEGFTVEVENHDDMNPIKESLGMSNPKLHSCHTAVIGDYVIEGHVPASDIKKILAEKPPIAGLTAPGMPMMSPGMNSRIPKDYAVLSFTESGESTVYSQY